LSLFTVIIKVSSQQPPFASFIIHKYINRTRSFTRPPVYHALFGYFSVALSLSFALNSSFFKMLFSKVTLSLSVLQIVAAHTVFTTLFVNLGDGTCIRMPKTPNNCTDPINDLASNDMACGFDGTVGVARVCPVTQASKLTFLFREYADGSEPGAIDISHKGPCAVYMKAVASAVTDVGYGAGWFKIWESGYDSTTSQCKSYPVKLVELQLTPACRVHGEAHTKQWPPIR
jgi:hypothetical protein